MWRVWSCLVVVACSSPNAVGDAAVDGKLCTCTATACTALGYATGTSICTPDCKHDEVGCDGCMADPAVTQCRSFAQPSDGVYLSSVTDGAIVAVAISRTVIDLYGADLAPVHEVTMPEEVTGLIAMPGGWIALPSTRFLATDGTIGRTHHLMPPAHDGKHAVSNMTGAAVDATRALLVWNEVFTDESGNVHPPDVHGAIVDGTGAVIVPRFPIRAESANAYEPVVTSDGTSLFVITLDQLTRLDATGHVVSTTPGFPGTPPNPIAVTYFAGWQGTTGWNVALGEHRTYLLQRFDAAGAKIGASVTIALPATPKITYLSGFSVDGDHLIALAWADRTQQMVADVFSVEISAAGDVSTPIALGVGSLDYRGKAERIGPELLTGWLAGDHAQLARLAP